ncbi:hypothetical protein CDV26_11065 [Francisella halioticida]|uniref:DUF3573 domain-containing protein n=1 Tax=Francisella halioticida TaxID=549298 RepID=A0ABN5AY95_9GAMM|nr:rhizoferrin import outer membrane protein FslE [Francisella halioticida]ASG68848.1 hypothetical protein CDV26_11065 [Francisella halioticida]
MLVHINILHIIYTLFIFILTIEISFSKNKDQTSSTLEQTLELKLRIQSLKSEIQNLQQNQTEFSTYNSKIKEIDSYSTINNKDSYEIAISIDNNSSIIDLKSKPLGKIFDLNGAINVGGAPAITTRGQITFLGSYSGNNSIPIGMISGSLFASTVIGQRNKFDSYSIFLGGKIEVDAQAWFGSGGISNKNNILANHGQNIFLTSATLYFLSNIGHYVTAQFDISTSELNNFGLENAFVILGNLDTSPFFLTAGRSKLSVGAFSGGGPWTGGITGFLAPGRTTNISLNYKNDILNANIAVFGSNDNQANFSTGMFYAESLTENLAIGLNTGYVYNIAGAGNASISQFLASKDSPNDSIGSFNINGNLTYTIYDGFLNIGAGWASTTNRNDFNDINENVLAGGWYTAANYSLVLEDRNTNFGISYGQTYNATNIPMPLTASPLSLGKSPIGIQRQLLLSSQRAYFDNNILMGIEYSYQQLYNDKHMNTVTLDLSVYI